MAADATIGSTVGKSSSDAKWVTDAVLACGATASILLLALIRWNSLISRKSRTALHSADTARAKYQRFFDEHPLPIWIFDDASLRIVAVNGAALRAFGYSDSELLNMSMQDGVSGRGICTPDRRSRIETRGSLRRNAVNRRMDVIEASIGIWTAQMAG